MSGRGDEFTDRNLHDRNPHDLAEVFRRESGRCIATLIRNLGDVQLAEDAVAEAFAIAAEAWPRTGTPPNPGAWVTATARNRAIDRLRRESSRPGRHLAAHRLLETRVDSDPNPERILEDQRRAR